MFDCLQFKRVMERSGLTKVELSELYGVSRQTLYAWLDHVPNQHTLAERAEKYTAGLFAAISRGLLPFPPSLSKEQRKERLRKMARHLHSLTTPQ